MVQADSVAAAAGPHLADCDLEEESEEQLRHQQELAAQALEIEREFWNCD